MKNLIIPLVLAQLVLGGCAQSTGPLWSPNAPRDGAQQVVDPVYGTPLPGYPACCGC
jgi:hypothetical protein